VGSRKGSPWSRQIVVLPPKKDAFLNTKYEDKYVSEFSKRRCASCDSDEPVRRSVVSRSGAGDVSRRLGPIRKPNPDKAIMTGSGP